MNKCRLKYSCRATIVSFLDSSEILRNAELQQRPTAVGHPKSMGPGCLLSWVLVRNSTTRTPLQRFLQQICHIAMPEPNISTCQDVGMWQIFVRCWCSLVVFVAGVRVVEFGSKLTLRSPQSKLSLQYIFGCKI